MSQASELLTVLKRNLRAQGITYAQIARHLSLSENSIKRIFSTGQISLQRLEAICEVAGLSLSELAASSSSERNKIQQLSEAQEQSLLADTRLLLVCICVLHHWRLPDIVETYALSEPECIKLLLELDKLRIIELLPLNRIRLVVAGNFRWREGGPIESYFKQKVQPEFFQSAFNLPGERLYFKSGMLSRESNAILQKKMAVLVAEFDERHAEDASLPLDQRFGSSIVVALRNWEFQAFNALRRQPNKKQF